MSSFLFVILLVAPRVLPAAGVGSRLESVSNLINPEKITLSGFSSGGTFAQTLQFSYSSLFSGIATISHAYYRCGPNNGDVKLYDDVCTNEFNKDENRMYNPEAVHEEISEYERKGLIQPVSNLKGKRLYVYAGMKSFLFSPKQGLGALAVYERYIGSPQTIYTRVQNSNLVMPTLDQGGECGASEVDSAFVAKCGFSVVDEAIGYILFPNEDNHAFEKRNPFDEPPNLVEFDQSEFSAGYEQDSFDDIGYYYIPDSCKTQGGETCYLHFFFHGCLTGREYIGTELIERSGLLELARDLRIIMIFPQIKNSTANPIGCWDTYGYHGPLYATQEGAQVKVLKKMLDRLLDLTDNGLVK